MTDAEIEAWERVMREVGKRRILPETLMQRIDAAVRKAGS